METCWDKHQQTMEFRCSSFFKALSSLFQTGALLTHMEQKRAEGPAQLWHKHHLHRCWVPGSCRHCGCEDTVLGLPYSQRTTSAVWCEGPQPVSPAHTWVCWTPHISLLFSIDDEESYISFALLFYLLSSNSHTLNNNPSSCSVFILSSWKKHP